MSGRALSVLLLAVLIGVIAVSGAVAADPGQYEVNVTDGAGTTDSTYRYNASAGAINVSTDGGSTWTQYSLSNGDESALAIQWAIDNSTSTNHTIQIGPGTYNGSVNVSQTGRTIIGFDGPANTNLTPVASSDEQGINVTAPDVHISAITVRDFSDPLDYGINIYGSSSNTTIDNVHFVNNAMGVNMFGDGAVAPNIIISNSSFTGGQRAIWNQNIDDFLYTNNSISGTTGTSIRIDLGDDGVVEDNTVENSNSIGIQIHAGNQNTVRNNTVEDSGSDGIAVMRGNYDSASENTVRDNVVTSSDSDGIYVNGNRTTLLGNNASLSTQNGVYLLNSTNVTIDGLIAEGNDRGVSIEGYGSNGVSNATVNSSFSHGIFVNSGAGGNNFTNITLDQNSNGFYLLGGNNEIRGVTATRGDKGIYLNSRYNRIFNSTTNYNSEEGIYVIGRHNRIENSTASHNTREGIASNQQNQTIRYSDAINNSDGINLTTFGQHEIVGNNASNNVNYGIQVEGDSNEFRRNIAEGNPSAGLRYSGNQNDVTNNTLLNNGYGLLVSGSYNTHLGNNASDNTANGINFAGSHSTFADTVLQGNAWEGILLQGSEQNVTLSNVTATANDEQGIVIEASSVSVSNSTIRLNTLSGVFVDSTNDVSLIDSVVSNNSEQGLRIDSSQTITVDGSSVANNTKAGINVSGSQTATLSDARVNDNGLSGVHLFESTDGTVENVTATGNGDNGIWVSNESERTVVDGATTSDNSGYSIYMQNSSDTTVNNSEVDSANLIVDDSPGATVRNNTVYATVWIKGGSDDANIDANMVDGVGYGIQTHNVANGVISNNDVNGSGINVYLSTNTENYTVTNNEVSNGTVGIRVSGVAGDNHTIRSNDALDNQYGIRVNANTTTIENNTVFNNTQYGINLDGGMSSHVLDNNVTENDGDGIYVSDSIDNTINSNEISNNNYGVNLVNANGTTIASNSVTNHSIGIYAQLSHGVEVRNNTVNGTGLNDGVKLASTAVNADIEDNTFDLVSGTAIESNGNDSSVRRNTVLSAWDGILLSTPTNVTVANNTLSAGNLGGNIGISDSGSSNELRNNHISDFNIGISLSDGDSGIIVGNNASENANRGIRIINYANGRIEDTILDDNGNYGIYVDGQPGNQHNNTFVNVTARGSGTAAYYAINVSAGTNTLTDFDVGDSTSSGTTIDAESTNVSISAVDAAPGSTPSGENELGRFLNVTNTSSTAELNVTLHYEDGDLSGLDESTIGLWNYTASVGWSERTSATLASGSNVSGNLTLTGDQTLGLYAEEDSSGGGGGPVFIPAPPSGDETGGSPSFSLSEIDLDSTEVSVGEAVTVSVRVDNDGDAHGTYTGNLTADGEVVETGSVQVNENYHATLELATSFDEPGTYQLAIDGMAAGTVEVTGEASFSLGDVSLSSTSVAPGDTVTITATVSNDGTAEDSIEVPLLVGSQQVDSRSVTLGPGESTTVTFEHTFDEEGSTSVSVGGQEVGTVDVATPAQSSGGGGGGGGVPLVPIVVVGGLIAIGSGAAYYFREEIGELIEQYGN